MFLFMIRTLNRVTPNNKNGYSLGIFFFFFFGLMSRDIMNEKPISFLHFMLRKIVQHEFLSIRFHDLTS